MHAGSGSHLCNLDLQRLLLHLGGLIDIGATCDTDVLYDDARLVYIALVDEVPALAHRVLLLLRW